MTVLAKVAKINPINVKKHEERKTIAANKNGCCKGKEITPINVADKVETAPKEIILLNTYSVVFSGVILM